MAVLMAMLGRRWRLVLVVTAWMAAAVSLLISGLLSIPDDAAAPVGGYNSAAQSCTGVTPPDSVQPAQLTLRDNVLTTVPFGRMSETQVREFDYIIDDPDHALANATCLRVEVGTFLRDTGDAQLDRGDIAATASVTGTRALVRISFDRSNQSLGQPGSYAGTLRIIDPRVERTDIPLQVTLSYPLWQFPVLLLLLSLLPAAIYVWLLKGSFMSSEDLTASGLETYLFSRNGIIAAGSGTVAAVSLFSATYLASPDWGDHPPRQAIALVGSMFAAFVAASTAVTAAGSDTRTPLANKGNPGTARAQEQ